MFLNLRAKMLQTSIYKLGNERKVRKEYNKKGNSFVDKTILSKKQISKKEI